MNFEDVLGFLRVDFEALNLGFQNLVVFLHLVNLCNPQLLHLCLLHLHLLLKPLLLLPHLKLLMSQLIFPNVDNLVHLCTDGQGCRQSGQSAHMCDHPRMVLLLLHVLLLQRHQKMCGMLVLDGSSFRKYKTSNIENIARIANAVTITLYSMMFSLYFSKRQGSELKLL